MRPRTFAVTVLLVFSAVLLWSSVLAETADITVSVSPIKGSPGQTVEIPIYSTDLTEFEIKELSFDVVYDRKVIRFRDIHTEDASLLWSSSGYLDEFPRNSRVSVRFTNSAFIVGKGKLLDLEFEVVGPKGSVGRIEIENFRLVSDHAPGVVLVGAEFRVLPTAKYLADRGVIEITSSEVFTSFQMELQGEVNLLSAQEESGWIFVQEGEVLSGSHAIGGTALYLLVSPDTAIVRIYSLTLGDNEKVQFAQRKLLIPVVSRQ